MLVAYLIYGRSVHYFDGEVSLCNSARLDDARLMAGWPANRHMCNRCALYYDWHLEAEVLVPKRPKPTLEQLAERALVDVAAVSKRSPDDVRTAETGPAVYAKWAWWWIVTELGGLGPSVAILNYPRRVIRLGVERAMDSPAKGIIYSVLPVGRV